MGSYPNYSWGTFDAPLVLAWFAKEVNTAGWETWLAGILFEWTPLDAFPAQIIKNRVEATQIGGSRSHLFCSLSHRSWRPSGNPDIGTWTPKPFSPRNGSSSSRYFSP